MFKSKCGDTDPYRCHHVRRPKHVAHQRRYWRSSTLCASEWVRHWYARLSRVGLIATVQSAWSDTNNFQCFAVFLFICFYVYMYTYTHIILNTLLYIYIYLCLFVYVYTYINVFMYSKIHRMMLFRIFLVPLQPIRYYCIGRRKPFECSLEYWHDSPNHISIFGRLSRAFFFSSSTARV